MTTDQEIINAASDDWESLDQIFISIRFEYASDIDCKRSPRAHYWRERNPGVTLSELIGSIQRLVRDGFLDVRLADRSAARSVEPEQVVGGWFRTTEAGRQSLKGVELM